MAIITMDMTLYEAVLVRDAVAIISPDEDDAKRVAEIAESGLTLMINGTLRRTDTELNFRTKEKRS